MRRNIEVEYCTDREPPRYKVRKKKGHFSLDELTEIAREIGTFDGYAVMVLDVRDHEDPVSEGDYVELFDLRDVWKGE
jgi:hypothetical protein